MELRKAIEERRSCRRYLDRPVDEKLLEELIREAMWAPSAMNMQPWFFKALTGRASLERMHGIMKKAVELFTPKLEERFEKHPEVIRETQAFMNTLGGAPVCVLAFLNREYSEKNYMDAVQSVAACIQNFCLLAHESGLSTCWLTGANIAEHLIREEFGKDLGRLVAVISVGYSDQKTTSGPKRKENRYIIE